MPRVTCLNGNEIVGNDGVNRACVDGLEDLLRQARDGEIVGYAVSLQFADGSTGEQPRGFLRNTRVIGGLMSLVVRLASDGD